MEYAICLLPVVPVRRDPNDRSEMLTQMLFGETARIFERRQKWLSVETDLDNYPGWVDAGQLATLDGQEYGRLTRSPVFLTDSMVTEIVDADDRTHRLPLGSCLPGLKGGLLEIQDKRFHVKGTSIPFDRGTPAGAVRTAMQFLNSPYLWGGKTLMGIDCSGLTQLAYRMNGLKIPRDARQQVTVGEQVSFLSEAKMGDLVFFDNPEGQIVHVGLVLDIQNILHASGRVKVDTLDHNGIYDPVARSYSHQLRIIRRVMP